MGVWMWRRHYNERQRNWLYHRFCRYRHEGYLFDAFRKLVWRLERAERFSSRTTHFLYNSYLLLGRTTALVRSSHGNGIPHRIFYLAHAECPDWRHLRRTPILIRGGSAYRAHGRPDTQNGLFVPII